jgi:hypothetical protein
MNSVLPFFLFGGVFILPGLVSLIGKGEKLALITGSNSEEREILVKGIFNTFRAFLVFAVCLVVQGLTS